LGTYPEVSLAAARTRCDQARELIADQKDPVEVKRVGQTASIHTFKTVAHEWLALQSKALSADILDMLRTRLDSYLIPRIGHRPIGAVTAQELLGALRRIEARGRHETAHRVRSLAGRVLRYAVATGRAERDVAADLKGALAPLLFVRPGELRAARWQEFDLD